MKHVMFLITFCCFSFLTRSQQRENLLPAYEALHLALVNADAPVAAEKAGLLVKALNTITSPANAALANAKKISATGVFILHSFMVYILLRLESFFLFPAEWIRRVSSVSCG